MLLRRCLQMRTCEHFGQDSGILACMHTLERHQITTPFAAQRLPAPAAVRHLMLALEHHGQQQPVVVIRGETSWELVDGYRRWEALGRLRVDTLMVECWECSLPEALAKVIARHQGRTLDPIEQAWLLQAALAQGESQRQLARWLGQDPSWVSRRLALLEALTEPMQAAVREGVVSSWAANRVLVPLARANTPAAAQLLERLRETPLATRELVDWYQHFQRSRPPVRERLLERPDLFRAVRNPSRNDPIGAWLQNVERSLQDLRRLRDPLAALLTVPPLRSEGQRLRAAVKQLQAALHPLDHLLESYDDAQRD